MAQYWLQIASAADLDAFTKVLGDGTIGYEVDSGMPSIVMTIGSDNRTVLRWDAVPNVADVKVAIYGRLKGKIIFRTFAVMARGDWVSQTVNEGWISYAYGTGGTGAKIAYTPAGSAGQTDVSDSALQIADSTLPHWNVLECNGTTIRNRAFDAAITGLGDQPAEWSGSVTNSNVPDAGYVGALLWRDATINQGWIYAISAATEGDPLPTGPVGGARRRSPLLLTPW